MVIMIQISDSAREEIIRLQAKQSAPDAFLRLKVKTGGCSGLLYVTEFDRNLQPQDQVHHYQGINIAIDAQSVEYLNGLALDFSEDLMGGSFRFHNPKATKICGCGVSFAVTES
jgi:iron-sulfur cluster assembly accessory protein